MIPSNPKPYSGVVISRAYVGLTAVTDAAVALHPAVERAAHRDRPVGQAGVTGLRRPGRARPRGRGRRLAGRLGRMTCSS